MQNKCRVSDVAKLYLAKYKAKTKQYIKNIGFILGIVSATIVAFLRGGAMIVQLICKDPEVSCPEKVLA